MKKTSMNEFNIISLYIYPNNTFPKYPIPRITIQQSDPSFLFTCSSSYERIVSKHFDARSSMLINFTKRPIYLQNPGPPFIRRSTAD